MQNIELKCRLGDRAAVERRLERTGARRAWTARQIDTFFEVPAGWLKLREVEGRRPELISYRRSTGSPAPRASDYDVIAVDDAAVWKRLLGRVLATAGVVDKERTLWLRGHSRIHLDRVTDLGDFLEIETVLDGISPEEGQAETEELVTLLGLDSRDFVAVPYFELLSSRSR